MLCCVVVNDHLAWRLLNEKSGKTDMVMPKNFSCTDQKKIGQMMISVDEVIFTAMSGLTWGSLKLTEIRKHRRVSALFMMEKPWFHVYRCIFHL